MNKKRTIVLIIGFLSLAIFGIIIMVMMYVKTQDSDELSKKKVTAYVATRNIALGQKIGLADVELQEFSESYTGSEALSMADIVDHYAQVDILKSDIIRPEKLTLKISEEEDHNKDANRSFGNSTGTNEIQHDAISLPLSVFKNPDTTLQLGEPIDILGMFEFGTEKHQFSTRYIALHVAVVGFMKDGKKVNAIASVQVDEKTQIATKVFADEILLDMSPRDIGNFLSLYYRSQELNNDRAHNPNNLYQGHMWMVKCNPVVSVADEAFKRRMMNTTAVARPKVSTSPSLLSIASLPKLILAPERGIVSYEE